MVARSHLDAARRVQDEEERRRGGGRFGPTRPRPAQAGEPAPGREPFRPFRRIGETLGRAFGSEQRTVTRGRPPMSPAARAGAGAGAGAPVAPRRAPVPGVGAPRPAQAAGPAGGGPPAGYTPALPAILREGGGGVRYTMPSRLGGAGTATAAPTQPVVGGGTAAAGITGRPPPPAAPGAGVAGVAGAPAPAPAPGAGPEVDVDWTQLGFGDQAAGENWAREFAAAHGGNMPWEEGTMSAQENLAEHLAALQWGQQFAETTGRPPGEGDYRIQWFKNRFGLGSNWRIPGASRGGGMGWMPREYM